MYAPPIEWIWCLVLQFNLFWKWFSLQMLDYQIQQIEQNISTDKPNVGSIV